MALTNPTTYSCGQCGHGWDEKMSACPNCGAAVVNASGLKRTLMTLLWGFVAMASYGSLFMLASAAWMHRDQIHLARPNWISVIALVSFAGISSYMLRKQPKG